MYAFFLYLLVYLESSCNQDLWALEEATGGLILVVFVVGAIWWPKDED